MTHDPALFKDVQNRYLTRSLFIETNSDKTIHTYKPIFTLDQPEDTAEGHFSVYRLYMESNDPTEYTIAMRMLGDLNHWKILTNLDFFRERLDLWRDELQSRIKSEALAAIREAVTAGGPQSLPAAKWIIENDLYALNAPRKKKVGRPIKEAEVIFIDPKTLAEDAARLAA